MYIFIHTSPYMKALYEAFVKEFQYEEAKLVSDLAVFSNDDYYVTEDVNLYHKLKNERGVSYLWLSNNTEVDGESEIYKFEPLANIFAKLHVSDLVKRSESLCIGGIPDDLNRSHYHIIIPLGMESDEACVDQSFYELTCEVFQGNSTFTTLKPISSIRPFLLKGDEERKQMFDNIIRNISSHYQVIYLVERYDQLFIPYLLPRVTSVYVVDEVKKFQQVLKDYQGFDFEIIHSPKQKRRWIKR